MGKIHTVGWGWEWGNVEWENVEWEKVEWENVEWENAIPYKVL